MNIYEFSSHCLCFNGGVDGWELPCPGHGTNMALLMCAQGVFGTLQPLCERTVCLGDFTISCYFHLLLTEFEDGNLPLEVRKSSNMALCQSTTVYSHLKQFSPLYILQVIRVYCGIWNLHEKRVGMPQLLNDGGFILFCGFMQSHRLAHI